MPPTLRTLVVDDEPIARQILCEELADLEGVEIVGEATNGEQALELIAELEPDLVLLDLQMPGKGGFDVIRELSIETMPLIVIVTAFDQHAIEAFDAGAIDYMLKPVSTQRLVKCIARARVVQRNPSLRSRQKARLSELASKGLSTRPQKVVGRIGDEYHLIDSNQVLAFKAERELVWILGRKQRYLATQTLRIIEERMSLHFVRVHRGALVNLDHVAKMAPLSSQRWLLTLVDGQEFIVSKRQATHVRQLLCW